MMQRLRPLRPAFFFLFLAAASVGCLAQAPPVGVLTNADVIKMIHAGLPESVIAREIRISPANFVVTPAAMIQLRRQGASEAILHAMLDSVTGPDANFPPPSPPQPAGHHTGVEANLRLSAKRHEKITVGHNELKLEQSGVPILSIKWKDAAAQ